MHMPAGKFLMFAYCFLSFSDFQNWAIEQMCKQSKLETMNRFFSLFYGYFLFKQNASRNAKTVRSSPLSLAWGFPLWKKPWIVSYLIEIKRFALNKIIKMSWHSGVHSGVECTSIFGIHSSCVAIGQENICSRLIRESFPFVFNI